MSDDLHAYTHIVQGLDPFGTPMIKYLKPLWVVCRYEYASETHCKIVWYRPVFVTTPSLPAQPSRSSRKEQGRVARA